RPVQDLSQERRRRRGLGEFPAGEVHRVRRPRRRRRRPRRRRGVRDPRQFEYGGRPPLPGAVFGAERPRRRRAHPPGGRGENGRGGAGRNRTGGAGAPLVLRVPVGTQVLDEDRETVLLDLVKPGERTVFLHGGDGGFGNTHYKSSTNRAPRRADRGWPGEERWVWLRLKLIADAGLVGLPNAGKSTLLAAVSRAKPKIADYPFTTLKPQLGVVRVGDEEFVLADLPGLIEGASEGAGLGHRFLGHAERCAVILHLIDGTQEDAVGAYRTIRGEIEAYGHGLAEKPEIIGLNKADAIPREKIPKLRRKFARASK